MILEHIHGVLRNMLRTSELDMAESVKASDIDIFLSGAAWAVHSTYHAVLKASPGAAIFEQDMLFDIPFIADWQKIGEYRQQLTDLSNTRENKGRVDYDYKVSQKVLLRKEGILHNAESRWHKKPWLITTVHTNGTITVQCENKLERMNIRRVKPSIVGAALENFPAQKRKKFWFHVSKKKRSQKNVTKNNRGHPQNRRFPLWTMVANIHLWASFRNVNIASSQL
jgi:hypothetical protein